MWMIAVCSAALDRFHVKGAKCNILHQIRIRSGYVEDQGNIE